MNTEVRKSVDDASGLTSRALMKLNQISFDSRLKLTSQERTLRARAVKQLGYALDNLGKLTGKY